MLRSLDHLNIERPFGPFSFQAESTTDGKEGDANGTDNEDVCSKNTANLGGQICRVA
jgi:hypothetical protein